MMQQATLAHTGWEALPQELAGHFPDQRASSRGMSLEQRLARRRREALPTPSPAEAPDSDAARGPLLVLDDVVTTGATLSSAVARASELGFHPVRCFALALAPDG
jgi:predicted amidophosphoribosyltransferase